MTQNNYRMDSRTKDQFIEDMRHAHVVELDIAIRLCLYHKNITGDFPTLIPTGVDFTGSFVPNNNEVIATADFQINQSLVEITKSATVCNRYFHEKTSKVNKCLSGQYKLVFVNGYMAMDEPLFVLITPSMMESLVKKSKKKYGIVPHPGHKRGVVNKTAYRFDIDWFEKDWQTLPKLSQDIKLPQEYMTIIKGMNNGKKKRP